MVDGLETFCHGACAYPSQKLKFIHSYGGSHSGIQTAKPNQAQWTLGCFSSRGNMRNVAGHVVGEQPPIPNYYHKSSPPHQCLANFSSCMSSGSDWILIHWVVVILTIMSSNELKPPGTRDMHPFERSRWTHSSRLASAGWTSWWAGKPQTSHEWEIFVGFSKVNFG